MYIAFPSFIVMFNPLKSQQNCRGTFQMHFVECTYLNQNEITVCSHKFNRQYA